MHSTEPMSICLATGNKLVLDLICTIPIVFCDIVGHAITQYMPCRIIKSLFYNNNLGMYWLKPTNPVINWVACSLELTLGDTLHTVFPVPVNSVANVTLSNLKRVLAEIKCSCPAWFSLLHPH